MNSSPLASTEFTNPHKQRRGMNRLWHATGHSLAGLVAGLSESAFRLEVVLAVPLLPAAFWLGNNWVEVVLLCGAIVAVLVVELLNTAVESAIDRIGPQWHEMSKRAKDLGSAAVLLSLAFCVAVWASSLFAHFR